MPAGGVLSGDPQPTATFTSNDHSATAPNRLWKGRVVPPKPRPGERGPRPYSATDMNALYATLHAESWFALVTLTPPSTARIDTWPELFRSLAKLKETLTNWHRREDFPAMLLVTEFDAPGSPQVTAHFHVVFSETLSKEQVRSLQQFWLKFTGAPNNQGRIFNYAARAGGPRLTLYMAKDYKVKDLVKYPAPWLPKRTECRLWFSIGLKHKPAQDGAALRAKGHPRRRKLNSCAEGSRASRGGDLAKIEVESYRSDSAHANPYKTHIKPLLPIRPIGDFPMAKWVRGHFPSTQNIREFTTPHLWFTPPKPFILTTSHQAQSQREGRPNSRGTGVLVYISPTS